MLSEIHYPLDVFFCGNCALVQLLHVVPAETIFDDYLYLSSSSRALKEHYARLATSLTSRFAATVGDIVVDIGCNDGALLHGYPDCGLVKVGVEPSRVATIASASGLNVVQAFFGPTTATEIVQRYGKAKIVTATNVFAHIDHVDGFLEGLDALLGDDGIFVIEAPYLPDLVDQTLFDTIYHEHLCYLSLTAMQPLFRRYGMDVVDAERVSIGASGPAFRILVGRSGRRSPGPSVGDMWAAESQWGIRNLCRYRGFARQVEIVRSCLLSIVDVLRRAGSRLGGYGAPAKGNTLLNYCGLGPDTIMCLAETNIRKQGLLTPGSHIPIVSEEDFLKEMPEYALLLSWNYLDFFLQRSEYPRRGGRFLVPVPIPRIVPRTITVG